MKSYSDFQECFKGIKSTMNKVAMLAMMIVSRRLVWGFRRNDCRPVEGKRTLHCR